MSEGLPEDKTLAPGTMTTEALGESATENIFPSADFKTIN